MVINESWSMQGIKKQYQITVHFLFILNKQYAYFGA
jgi:hypothetical protein